MTQGWKITLGLSALALLAALVAPRLQAATQTAGEPDQHADVCLRLGPYECCYDPEAP